MSNRVFNFSAGPAMLPLEVLEASAKALVDYQGKGFGIAECSHRGKEFDGVIDEVCRLSDSNRLMLGQDGHRVDRGRAGRPSDGCRGLWLRKVNPVLQEHERGHVGIRFGISGHI